MTVYLDVGRRSRREDKKASKTGLSTGLSERDKVVEEGTIFLKL